MSRFFTVPKLVRTALIAAVYTALCLALAPISFGGFFQLRVSEALTLLPVLCPEAILGVTVGCFLSNLIGSTLLDAVTGSIATLLAALVTYALRNVRIKKLALPASLPPVFFNMLIVGATLAYLEMPRGFTAAQFWPVFGAISLSVGVGQLVSCCVLGVGLVWVIEKSPALMRAMQGRQ